MPIPSPSHFGPIRALAAVLVLTSTAFAQSDPVRVAFPMRPSVGAEPGPLAIGERSLVTDISQVASLMGHDAVTMTGFPLPGGESVTLELVRVNVDRRRFGIHVDGAQRPDVLGALNLTVWEGTVEGDPQSEVMLGFSNYGSRGWIRTQTSLVHLLAVSHSDGSWLAAPGAVTTEAALNASGMQNNAQCETAPPPVAPTPSAYLPLTDGSAARLTESITLRECPIAMETDWQYYQLFNDLNAATSYAATLLSFVSNRYELQASTLLTFPYLQIYTTPNDPWATPDNGGSSSDMLNEFVAAWQGNVPMNATLGHMMSGANLGGGVAYLDVLCNPNFNFGVSGNLRNLVNFPVVQQPNNWDFVVIAHEIGHNFDAPHTHEFCPPLDECPPSQYFGPCQTQQACSNMGTIMSYCHLCAGGTGNITTHFHPDNADRMRDASAACNSEVLQLIATAPDIVSDSSSTQASLQEVTGTLVSATLMYRESASAPFSPVPMVEQSGGLWLANVPPVACSAEVDIYFSFTVSGLGNFSAPLAAPAEMYRAEVGTAIDVLADNFESQLNWQTANNGASSGDWERGVPVNDGGWQYDPVSDFDGSGSCYLTQNQAGNTDVDGGSVALTSPTFDFSSPSSRVNYAYYLNLTNSDGVDRMLVEARSAGGAYVEVTRHDVSNGLDWTPVSLTQADFIAAGLVPGPAMDMRFTVNDGDAQSIVEAGLDAFYVGYVECGGPGSNYCSPANPNSTGAPGTIRASGSSVATDNDLTLTSESLPSNSVGYFLTSRTQGFVGNAGSSVGNLCVLGSIGRYTGSVLSAGPGGTFSLVLDLTNTPQPLGFVSVASGDTWNYQCWYRDSLLGSPTSNFTDAVSVTFQ